MAGAKKKGEKLEINMDPDALGGVVFDLPVGHAGGDTITVHVGSTDECKDGTVVLQTWRKLYYELMVPECMKPRLQQNEAKKWDLQETTRKWAKDRLAPVFIEYELKEAHVFDNAKITNWLHDGAYLGKPAGSYYVLGDPAAYSNDPVSFGAAENRTIFVRGCDVIADANAAAAVELEVTKAETRSRGPEIYKVDPGTGNPSVSAVGWEAVIDPAANPTHPGVVAGKAKSGAFAIDAIELVTKTTFKVKLSGDAAALAGSLSETKCPIKVSWKWRTADPYNGSASGGRQLMNLGRPVRPVACTICHELGHSMGMTVLDKATDSTHVAKGQTSVFQCKPPEGLPYPDPVPDGDAYDGHDHTGDHCASGLTKAQKSGDHYGGLKGTCIMFGEGGDAKNPSRNAFCATCAKYLKARNLADLKTGWAARANSSLYEKGG